jgi:hypothetical protein
LEHQVEGNRGLQSSTGSRVGDFVLDDELTKFSAIVVVNLPMSQLAIPNWSMFRNMTFQTRAE